MNIHQLSVAYHLDQDRILVQINTQTGETLRLWLTRRLVLNLLPTLNQATERVTSSSMPMASQDALGQKMLMEFKKQESVSQADFKTPFKSETSDFPLGAEPLLVTHMQMTPVGNGVLQIGFEERHNAAPSARSFQITLESPMLLSFIHLFEAAIQTSQWGILPQPAQDKPDEPAADAAAPTGPPRYLN